MTEAHSVTSAGHVTTLESEQEAIPSSAEDGEICQWDVGNFFGIDNFKQTSFFCINVDH